MPQLRAGASNTPLWSLIPAKTGGLSWLGEVNRLVCVTEPSGHHFCQWWPRILLRYPWDRWAICPSLPAMGSMVGGGTEE